MGDQLSLQLARTGELAQRAQLEQELASLQAQIAGRESEIASRTATGDLAAKILAALREASSEIVAAELERVSPILQRIYATVDPHPAFRAVRFLTKTVRGRGRLWATIDDATAEVTVDEPATVLSSSQVNVLALSVFLALNLGIDTLPLEVVALDDPLQSLDDVNLLGFVDLLRRMKGRRQIIISTHDPKLGALLCRKLRPVSAEGRSRLITLEGWAREGPSVIQDDLPRDPKPLRLVA
jgi:DNA repair exonuclease SbcCD ATPase subunit